MSKAPPAEGEHSGEPHAAATPAEPSIDQSGDGSTTPTSRQLKWAYALGGIVATAMGMVAGAIVAGLVDPGAAPVLAVGSSVIDATPLWLKEWATSTLGTADKPVLIAGVAVVTLLATGLLGLLARTRRTAAMVGLIVLGGVALAAAMARPSATATSVLPAGATTFVALAAANYLWGAADRWGRSAGSSEEAPARRSVLIGTGAISAVALLGWGLSSLLTRAPSSIGPITLPTPRTRKPPLPKGIEAKAPGVSSFVTPNDDFYVIDTALVVPRVDPADWSLTIDGMVDNPYEVSWDELLAMPMIEADITLACVSNEIGGEYVGSARWLGVRTAELLKRAGVQPEVEQILSTSVDGMTISTPIQALTDDRNALIAIAMNGEQLPTRHGFPARMVTPGLYGFTGATKWVSKLTATTYAKDDAYWSTRGWATDAPVLTQSRIDTPRQGAGVKAGEVIIGGVAWAQHRGITGVEVRVDNGAWKKATLGPDAGIDFWRQWYLPWKASAGNHRIMVRATDGTGETQTQTRSPVAPDGARGWHTITVNVS